MDDYNPVYMTREEVKRIKATNIALATHKICCDCIHRWHQDGPPPYHPESWCYMFFDGAHLNAQGYCGQFQTRSEAKAINTTVNERSIK